MERRSFLRGAVVGTSAAAFGFTLWQGAASAAPAQPGPGPYGALGPADANGIQLPAGFTSRVVARSGQRVGSTSYTWHNAPDGGACYNDGTGWIYVSNSEINRSSGLSRSESAQSHAPNGLGRTGPRRTRPRGGDTHPVRGPDPGGRLPARPGPHGRGQR
ncbi:secreted PhoX family phosphatase [Streptomyces pristinaespiralis]